MKTNNINKIISIILFSMVFSACVKDGEFDLPNLEVVEPNITVNSNILAVKSALIQEFNASGNLIYTFFENPNTPTFIEGYVVSSDATGNFFRTLIIQDTPSEPSAGIEINLNDTSLSDSYEVGRKIYIKLDGLSVSYDDGESENFIDPSNNIAGKYVLGILDRGEVIDIPSTQIKNHIFKSATVEEIIPKILNLDDISGENINTLIQLNGVQFLKQDLKKTFAGEPNDEFDGFRTIFKCSSGFTIPLLKSTLLLQTSTFSSFKSNTLPEGFGSIITVLSKDFRSELIVGILNTPEDINFNDSNRCAQVPVLECNNTQSIENTLTIFEEDFESIVNSTDLIDAGFINSNVVEGTTIYSPKSRSGERYVEISAFNTDENPVEAWLITPEINLDNTNGEKLTFETSTAFDNGDALSIFIATDFSGDLLTANWIEIENAILSEGPRSGSSNRFTKSGSIDISCLSGNVVIGFRYVGGDGGVSTTFRIDNIKVIGN